MTTVLLLYVPVLHQSYIQLFQKYRGTAETLYLLTPEFLLPRFPTLTRELRAIDPLTIQQLLTGAGFFPKIELAGEKTLQRLGKDPTLKVITTTEAISDKVGELYLTDCQVEREPLFLRYDEKVVTELYGEARYDCRVTQDEFLRQLGDQAKALADTNSSDWFRRVGAVLLPRDSSGPLRFAYNVRMPSDHEVWAVGDPRMYLPYGTDTNQTTALHAENALIAECAREGIATRGADILVTVFPCPSCRNSIAWAGFQRCYFLQGYAKLESHDPFRAFGVEVVQII